MDVIDKCLETSSLIKNDRDIKDVTIKLMEECGEVAQEISKLGISKYKANKDEIAFIKSKAVSEASDAFNCIVDLVYLLCNKDKEMAKEALTDFIKLGLEKWESKYNENSNI